LIWKSTFEYFYFAHFIDIVLAVQITFLYGIFNVVAYAFEDEELRGFYEEEEEDKWLIKNEFVDNFSFKISSPGTHQICGFNLFVSCVTSASSAYRGFINVYIEIRNNTSGRSLLCPVFVFHMRYACGVREMQSLLHRKLGGNDPTFDNGDDVSISVRPHGPTIQVRTIGVQWLHEEEGEDDDDAASQIRTVGVQWLHEEEEEDDDDIQSKDEVLNAHNSSDDDDDAHVAKVEIASRIFRNYYCAFHGKYGKYSARSFAWWYFAKKGLELVLY
jgi:hypothetical protein